MFKLDGNLKFVNVDMDYLKHLHNACSEVFYKPNDYDNKPYLGVLMTNNDKKYVLPLTSAKEKHKTWKDTYPDRFLVFAIEDKEGLIDIKNGTVALNMPSGNLYTTFKLTPKENYNLPTINDIECYVGDKKND